MTEMERIGKSLPGYISSRREFDEMTVAQVRTALVKRGKITATATHKEVEDACRAARRLFDLYLR